MREFIIQENDANQRLDKFVLKVCPSMPKNLLYKYVRNKKIKINRARCNYDTRLQENDTIQMYIAEDFFVDQANYDFLNCKKLTQIVYEDENILVVHKPAGVLMHSDISQEKDTLQNRVLRYLYESHQYDPQHENSFVPAVCNRLDRNTEGLVIACKNAMSSRFINEKIQLHEIEKHYLCIVSGNCLKEAYLKHYYKKDEKNNKAMIYDEWQKGCSVVELSYKTIQKGRKYDLCDVNLITGKSHQIRAQMAHMHHPLIGDKKYQGDLIRKEGQALCAYELIFKFNECPERFLYLKNKKITSMYESLSKEFEQKYKNR